MRLYSIIAAGALGLSTLAFLPACQTVSGKVPSTAMEVSAGTGSMTYRASDTGHLYVYDQNRNALVYSGHVNRGDVLVLDTRGERVLVNNAPVVERVNLDGADRYQIFLDPHPYVAGGRVTETVERRPVLERRDVVVPKTTYERREVVVPKTTYEHKEVVVPSGQTVERRTYIDDQGRTVIERDVQDR